MGNFDKGASGEDDNIDDDGFVSDRPTRPETPHSRRALRDANMTSGQYRLHIPPNPTPRIDTPEHSEEEEAAFEIGTTAQNTPAAPEVAKIQVSIADRMASLGFASLPPERIIAPTEIEKDGK